MNQIEAFKQKVKSVIEKHGGRVDIGIIPGVIEQPIELRSKYLPGNVYAPIEIVFDGTHLKIHTSGVNNFTPEMAKEFSIRFQMAVEILEEIESDTS